MEADDDDDDAEEGGGEVPLPEVAKEFDAKPKGKEVAIA